MSKNWVILHYFFTLTHLNPECFLHFQPISIWQDTLFILFFCFLRPYPRHMEVPGLGVKSELQLPDYITATATPDPSHVCDLHHSSRQRWIILNLLSEARDQTLNLVVLSRIPFHWATTGTPTCYKSFIAITFFPVLLKINWRHCTSLRYTAWQFDVHIL